MSAATAPLCGVGASKEAQRCLCVGTCCCVLTHGNKRAVLDSGSAPRREHPSPPSPLSSGTAT